MFTTGYLSQIGTTSANFLSFIRLTSFFVPRHWSYQTEAAERAPDRFVAYALVSGVGRLTLWVMQEGS
jgi:hypothetical protein